MRLGRSVLMLRKFSMPRSWFGFVMIASKQGRMIFRKKRDECERDERSRT